MLVLGCSSKEDLNPLGRSLGDVHDSDPLKLGSVPKEPKNLKITTSENSTKVKVPLYPPSIKSNPSNIDFKPQPRLLGGQFSDVAVFESKGVKGDFVTIMNPAGSILVASNPNPGNWIWAYTLLNSKDFRNARAWQLIEFPNNNFMIKNSKTGTCLNAYNGGVVHYPCDESNQAQFWTLIPYNNKAVKIQNLATKTCMRVIIKNPLKDFDTIRQVFLTKCAPKGQDNLDQQWYITAPAFNAKPLYLKGEK
ncbi:cytolethal distending toxin subunit A [Campylobacter lari]|nr:cytolethal distending toxin subunit A [Campylobacter lari]EAJ1262064.1 cytolethal distending toxin subunit A [Campylobacter lari]EAL3938719.1 cytolethal distending toxin subunit A [Campylobacter lari]EAL3939846.1 cytolethal distending toxin subunit A [Campylobacter lari]MPB99441.1 cytolethal distending toxin subunit A [Campylobacter subantarcticus]